MECLGKTKEAKEFKELTNENFKKTIAESMPQYPVLRKKYHECETKRIDKLYDDHVIYSINLFYMLSGI